MITPSIYGCIEAGGTKFILGIVTDTREVLATLRIPTEAPSITIPAALAFFREGAIRHGPYAAFGIASFGPVDVDRRSPSWGHLIETPKVHWSNIDLAGPFAKAFDCPVGFDTDVNGAALAESLWGAAVGADIATYITVGTGVGGGAMVEGRPIHGQRHPEMGHFRPARHPHDTRFDGICAFHGACLEGLASGPAIIARWGASLSDLPADHEAHDIIAHYLAQLVIAQQALLSPRRIIFGGGVMDTSGLLQRVRDQAAILAADYFGVATIDYDALIVSPALGDQVGLMGALALAQRAR
ncbi:ROK family protein [Sphingobium aromaticiconvertens]|uniref:ROK family protein n=1 Tax=Sphingobium aromaticiconvertens TaxID=365341 RepID=UPI00301AB584